MPRKLSKFEQAAADLFAALECRYFSERKGTCIQAFAYRPNKEAGRPDWMTHIYTVEGRDEEVLGKVLEETIKLNKQFQ